MDGAGEGTFSLSHQFFWDPSPIPSRTRFVFDPQIGDKKFMPRPPTPTPTYPQQPLHIPFYLFYVRLTSVLYETQGALLNDLWSVYFFCIFFYLIIAICKYVFECSVKLLILRGVWGRSPPERTTVLSWQGIWRSDTTNAGLNLLENKNHLLDIIFRPLYPVQGQWHPEGDQSKGAKAGYCNYPSNTLEQLFQIMAQKQKFSQGLNSTAALTKRKPIWRDRSIS